MTTWRVQYLVPSDPSAVKLCLSEYTLQVPQNAWLGLLELFGDFFPHTFLQDSSFFALSEPTSLSDSAVTQILSLGLWALAGSMHKRSATILGSSGEEQLVEPEDPRQQASDFPG